MQEQKEKRNDIKKLNICAMKKYKNMQCRGQPYDSLIKEKSYIFTTGETNNFAINMCFGLLINLENFSIGSK